MRNPSWGNRWRFFPNSIFQRTLGADLIVIQGGRPTWEGFQVEYEALSYADLLTVENFLINTAGQLITLTDFEGRNWTGMVSSPEIEVVEGRDNCSWKIGFQFEGHVSGEIQNIFNSPFIGDSPDQPTIPVPDTGGINQYFEYLSSGGSFPNLDSTTFSKLIS